MKDIEVIELKNERIYLMPKMPSQPLADRRPGELHLNYKPTTGLPVA